MDGLFRRGGVWWARLVVPARLRAAAGRREFVKSTGAHDRVLGKLVASVLLADWRRQLIEMERGGVDEVSILKLVEGSPALTASGFLTLERAAEFSGLPMGDLLREAEVKRLSLACRIPRSASEGYVADLLTQLPPPNAQGGYDLPNEPPAGALVVHMGGNVLRLFEGGYDVAKAILAEDLDVVDLTLFEREWGRWREVFSPFTRLQVPVSALEVRAAEVEAVRAMRAAMVSPERIDRARVVVAGRASPEAVGTSGAWSQRRFLEALAAYCADPDGLPGDLRSEHEQRQRKAGIAVFAEFMGNPRLGEINGDLLRAFRDGPLKTIPASANKLPKAIRRETMTATIEALRADGREWPMLNEAMRHERILWLVRMFEWLERKGYLRPNPAAGLRSETGLTKAEQLERARQDEDDEDGRDPFTDAQIRAIFGQQHFVSGSARHLNWEAGRWYPFEYWLPLLGLYGGVRIKEGAQLHLKDVREVDGVWVLDINESTRDKSLKTPQSRRLIPIHPHLVRLGFVDYCKRLRAEGFQRVFPELTWATTPAKYAKEPVRKMSAMLEKLGMPRNGRLVFHCLRHNCNNALLRVPSSVLTQGGEELCRIARLGIMGHTLGKDVNSRHYTDVTPREMAALMSGVRFDLPEIAPFDIGFGLECVRVALARKIGERRGMEDMGPLGGNRSEPA